MVSFHKSTLNYFSISIFAVFGCFLRISFSLLNEQILLSSNGSNSLFTEYRSLTARSYLISLFLGCAILSFVDVNKKRETGFWFLKNSLLSLGISTGFCGSLTTLSGLLNEAGQFILLDEVEEKDNCTDFFKISKQEISFRTVENIFNGFCVSFAGWFLGKHLENKISTSFEGFSRKNGNEEVKSEVPQTIIVSFLSLNSTIVVLLVLDLSYKNFLSKTVLEFLFSLLFAPFGALTRYVLGRLNRPEEAIKKGTLAANVLGCFLIAVFTALSFEENKRNVNSLFIGFMDGFCGSLTTVSTFVSEMTKSKSFKCASLHNYYLSIPNFCYVRDKCAQLKLRCLKVDACESRKLLKCLFFLMERHFNGLDT
eukprot:snap_masked-scaffold_8-processed-gene-5.31-mRNA-1 protein AED:0.39 eAED:0.39 QI:0/0/0/0.5/1/1/2/0/367